MTTPHLRRAAVTLAVLAALVLAVGGLGTAWLGGCHSELDGTSPCAVAFAPRHGWALAFATLALVQIGPALATAFTREPRHLVLAALPSTVLAAVVVLPRLP